MSLATGMMPVGYDPFPFYSSLFERMQMMLDRDLAMEAVRVSEAAAIAAAGLMGRGDEKAADQVAVDAMRRGLNTLEMQGTVVIGEGERDEAPMLYIGEKVGTGTGPKVDIALDPLEGTTICATGGANSRHRPMAANHGRRRHDCPTVSGDPLRTNRSNWPMAPCSVRRAANTTVGAFTWNGRPIRAEVGIAADH